MAFSGSVWDNSYRVVEEVTDIVEDRLDDAVATAEELRTRALAVLDELGTVSFNPVDSPPNPPNISSDISLDFSVSPVSPTSFGEIDLPTGIEDAPVLDPVPSVTAPDIPEFTYSVGNINLPTAPVPAAPGSPPVEPTLGTVTIPAQPNVTVPSPPALIGNITIPTFSFPTLPTFDGTPPAEQGLDAPESQFNWVEPTYGIEILDEAMTQIRAMWAGTKGLPSHIVDALFAGINDREDKLTAQNVKQVDEEFSLRGFTLPSGVQIARMDAARNEGLLRKQEANRAMNAKLADVQVENIRFGVQQAIAAEQVLVNIFLNSTERLFQAEKYRLEADVSIYNAKIALYNARQQAYQIRAEVFKAELQAALAELEVFKAQVDAELAKGRINESMVNAYRGEVEAFQAQMSAYETQMRGASIQSDLIKAQIDQYKARIEAFVAVVESDKLRFDAYEAQVRGETAKANILESQAKAYAATIQGKATEVDAQKATIEAVAASNKAKIDAYMLRAERDKMLIEAQLSVIKANVEGFVADTQRYTAEAGVQEARAKLEVSAKELELRTVIAYYEAQVRAYVANMEAMMRQAGLAADALKSTGEITSTLAAGAMAGISVGANLSGSGSVGASGSGSESFSNSESYSVSHTYAHEGLDEQP